MNKKYYITTAIAYTSGKPHIGNTYEAILADAIARFKRLEGYDVYFQTGTDEHGQKIEDKAKLNNMSPKEYVNNVAHEIRKIWDLVNISYDNFIRTTDPVHEEKVQKIFKKLYEKGDIYLGTYEGLYCSPCESFWTENQLVDGKCPDCNGKVKIAKEEAYFLRTSKYQNQLINYIKDNPFFISPISRKNEMLNNFLLEPLPDLCVSRTSFKWGIPVTFNDKHVIYVWIDALSNYITFIGYDTDYSSDEFYKWWPADLHLIGKDILRFHTIYWPIILMALDLPLPKKIFGHPWLLTGSDKMSKSKGNVIYADDLVKYFGVDPVRYYVLKETPYANDGNISYELLIEKTNGDLVNNLGNLVNRTLSMANKYFVGKVAKKKAIPVVDDEFIKSKLLLKEKVISKMNNLEVGLAIEEIMTVLRGANKYIDETLPWKLFKDNELEKLETVIYNLLDTIKVSSILLQSFIPDTANKILNLLNVEDRTFDNIYKNNNFEVLEPEIIYQRIDVNAKLEEINNN